MSTAELIEAPTAHDHRLRWLARLMLGSTIAAVVAGAVISLIDTGTPGLELAFVSFFLFPVIGYILAIRRPENAVSWVMLGIALALGMSGFMGSYASYAIHGGPGGLRVGAVVVALDQATWIPIVGLPVTFLLLLFPDGHLPSPRWRWFARILGASMVIAYLAIVFTPGPMTESDFPHLRNPLGIESLGPFLDVALVSLIMLPIGVIASLVSLVMRFRLSSGIERLQLRWLVTAAATVGILYALTLVLSFNTAWSAADTPTAIAILQAVAISSFGLIPIAIGISILRYHLFDLDLVINKALLFGAMAIFISAVYAAIVVGIGAIVGSKASPLLSAAAAAIVALAFQPARRRAQRFADRLVYGERATPYEVLSAFSERLGTAYASDELLPRMARALAEGTGAQRADVLVRIGDELRAEAWWPLDAGTPEPIDAAAAAEGSATPTSMIEPVAHQGELLGALSVTKAPGDAIHVNEERLIRDLAAQAGLVIRNVALTDELVRTIDELRASRQRLVSAQDEGRRRIERNLHDGAQQQIVALTVKLRLLGQVVERDTEQAKKMAAAIQADANDALGQLRDLARGIYPPLLADQGLVAALQAQARKSSVPTEVRSDGIGRYAQDTEAAVYFCVLEALNNVAKYSEATSAEVRFEQRAGELSFAVVDDGAGFDTSQTTYGTGLIGMADRLDAIGGSLRVVSHRGGGTTVEGRVPAAQAATPLG
jgi:signal transduction histidine kinase